MKIISKYDAPNKEQATIYDVELDDGRIVSVKRKHFPTLMGSAPLSSVMEPHDEDIDEREALRKLWSICEDFGCARFIRRARCGFAAINDACYSLEQAYYLADQLWNETKNKDSWDYFYIKLGDKVIKDYKKEYKNA